MLITFLEDTDGSRCTLAFDETEQWVRATWRGYVNAEEAMRGADTYVAQAGPLHCPYLLNDNAELRGCWFDSVEWLQQAWLPQAVTVGLRYIAHVVQRDTRTDILTLTFPEPVVGVIELQLFDRVADAAHWLRSCQRRDRVADSTGGVNHRHATSSPFGSG